MCTGSHGSFVQLVMCQLLAVLSVLLFVRLKSERYNIFVLKSSISRQTLLLKDVNISIESHFVGDHGRYELHRKE